MAKSSYLLGKEKSSRICTEGQPLKPTKLVAWDMAYGGGMSLSAYAGVIKKWIAFG
ncbi:hypothetical protein [Paenibacillus sp.]|jgi:hypothetical protein|uniref:hypothetical protein n=1 Tax=Paenibacillus sp. TaxID=58172 RepID=UPI00283AA663|nr:hypothetical protein [Paenibacillus sp.]